MIRDIRGILKPHDKPLKPLRRILKPHDIRVTTKPLRTLEQMFPSTKDRPLPENQTNVVYQITVTVQIARGVTLARQAGPL